MSQEPETDLIIGNIGNYYGRLEVAQKVSGGGVRGQRPTAGLKDVGAVRARAVNIW